MLRCCSNNNNAAAAASVPFVPGVYIVCTYPSCCQPAIATQYPTAAAAAADQPSAVMQQSSVNCPTREQCSPELALPQRRGRAELAQSPSCENPEINTSALVSCLLEPCSQTPRCNGVMGVHSNPSLTRLSLPPPLPPPLMDGVESM